MVTALLARNCASGAFLLRDATRRDTTPCRPWVISGHSAGRAAVPKETARDRSLVASVLEQTDAVPSRSRRGLLRKRPSHPSTRNGLSAIEDRHSVNDLVHRDTFWFALADRAQAAMPEIEHAIRGGVRSDGYTNSDALLAALATTVTRMAGGGT